MPVHPERPFSGQEREGEGVRLPLRERSASVAPEADGFTGVLHALQSEARPRNQHLGRSEERREVPGRGVSGDDRELGPVLDGAPKVETYEITSSKHFTAVRSF